MIEHREGAAVTPRNQAIEILRIVSAYGVVAFHAHVPFYDLAYSGLTIFLILLTYVDCAFNWEARRSILSLSKSLLVPWLIWMIVCAAWNVRTHKPVLLVHPWVAGILSGTAPHLWFLPTAWAVLVALNQMKGRTAPVLLFGASGVLAAGLLVTAPLWHARFPLWSPPCPQWFQASPALLFGVVLGLAGRVPRAVLWGVGAVLALAGASLLVSPITGITVPYLVGAACVLIALWLGPRIGPDRVNVRPLSACMLGVYLGHPLGLNIIGMATGKHSLTTVNLTFVVMLAVTWVAQRYVPLGSLAFGKPEFWAGRRESVIREVPLST